MSLLINIQLNVEMQLWKIEKNCKLIGMDAKKINGTDAEYVPWVENKLIWVEYK